MKKYIQSSSENENGDVFLQRITKQLGLGRSEASMFIHDVNNLRGDEWLEWVQEECTPEDAKKFEKWYCGDENAYDDNMFSDWEFSDMAEFIAKNFESIAGLDICSIYNPEDENLPIFDDSVIEETHPDIRNFLETHTDWDSTTIDEFYYFLDEYLTSNRSALCGSTNIKASKDIDTMIEELSRYRSIQDHVAQIKEAYPGIDGEDLIQFFAIESDISDEDAESVLTYLNLLGSTAIKGSRGKGKKVEASEEDFDDDDDDDYIEDITKYYWQSDFRNLSSIIPQDVSKYDEVWVVYKKYGEPADCEPIYAPKKIISDIINHNEYIDWYDIFDDSIKAFSFADKSNEDYDEDAEEY